MKLYEITNPSDKYTLEAESDAVACATTLMLGEGAYGLRDEQGNTVLGVLLLASAAQTDDELRHAGVWPLSEYVEAHKEEIATCAESVVCGSIEERKRLVKFMARVPETERAAAWAEWHDQRHGSMNDIGSYAKSLAAMLRKSDGVTAQATEPAP